MTAITSSPGPASVAALDKILSLRAIVARYGEPDQMAWWTHDTLNLESGVFVAGRLFPRTHKWAAVELATATVALHDRQRLNGRSAATLFVLPAKFERAIDLRLRELKMSGQDPSSALGTDLFSRELPALAEAIASESSESHVDRKGVPEASGTLLRVGEVKTPALEDSAALSRVVGSLATAYLSSDRARLALPYYALTGSGGER